MKPSVTAFFDEPTFTVSYVVVDEASKKAVIIDSVLNFDPASGRTSRDSADEIITFVKKEKLEVEWILETHVHADHLSAAPYLQEKVGGKIAIGSSIAVVQDTFGKIFNAGTEFERDGTQFDALFRDGDVFHVGSIPSRAMHTPGHTPACMTYLIGDAAFVGDTLFMPDGGSARADFPGGDAGVLYDSIQKLLTLPDDMRLFMCHDYGPNGRDIAWETTVASERDHNIHVGGGASREDFIALREARDATLDMPTLEPCPDGLMINGKPIFSAPIEASSRDVATA